MQAITFAKVSSSPAFHTNVAEIYLIIQTGGFEVIEKTNQPFPEITQGNLVIKVLYCDTRLAPIVTHFSVWQIQYGGVNFIDTYMR